MQIMISRGACGCREAKKSYQARVLIPTTSAGGHQLGNERRVVDVQFIGSDAHDGTIFGVHIADAEDVLAVAEAVMVEFVKGGHGCNARPRELGKWMQSEAVGVEEDDIEQEGDNDGCQWPSGNQIEDRHGIADTATSRAKDLKSTLFPWTSNNGDQKQEEFK